MFPLLLLSVALAGPRAPTAHDVQFAPLAAPETLEERSRVRFSPSVVIDGVSRPLTFQTLTRTGEPIGGVPFGVIVDRAGKVMVDDAGAPLTCDGADFGAVLEVGRETWLLQHVECIPSALYATQLTFDPAGIAHVQRTLPLAASPYGAVNHCAGVVTPWNTLLSSQEYEPEARAIGALGGQPPNDDYGYTRLGTYLGVPMSQVDPYRYGWMPEVTPKRRGATTSFTSTLHPTMGRFSHELGSVLPDGRTVLLSDDGPNGGLFLFVADRRKRLSAGTLYAAKLRATDAGSFDLTWMDLGHATDDEVTAALDAGVSFDDLFATAEPSGPGTCPQGYTSTRTMDTFDTSRTLHECLRLKPGMETVASRLETRRYAAYLGATTELLKAEGITFDAQRRTAFLAVTDIGKGMLDAGPHDLGGPNDIALPANACGAIFKLALGPSEATGSDWTPLRAATLAQGKPLANDRCDADAIANPDNLTLLTGSGWLIAAEDTRRHDNATLWAIDIDSGVTRRLASAPWGGEFTGIWWHRDVADHAFLTVTVQHPFAHSRPEGAPADAEMPSFTGIWGPFPVWK
ncbi:MAG: hypothetical protein RLZZ383_1285 [Pseudomonadota bacterium]|jgi:secreted PhoX family phosphatase